MICLALIGSPRTGFCGLFSGVDTSRRNRRIKRGIVKPGARPWGRFPIGDLG
jgi:hypothetical protein